MLWCSNKFILLYKQFCDTRLMRLIFNYYVCLEKLSRDRLTTFCYSSACSAMIVNWLRLQYCKKVKINVYIILNQITCMDYGSTGILQIKLTLRDPIHITYTSNGYFIQYNNHNNSTLLVCRYCWLYWANIHLFFICCNVASLIICVR